MVKTWYWTLLWLFSTSTKNKNTGQERLPGGGTWDRDNLWGSAYLKDSNNTDNQTQKELISINERFGENVNC